MLHKILPILLLLSVSRPAFAGDDVVYLKNGSRISGEVMEVMVDDYVSIRLADGRVKTIPWADVDRVEDGRGESTAAPAEPAPTTEPAPSATPAPTTEPAPSATPETGTFQFISDTKTVQIRHITSAGSAMAVTSTSQYAAAFSQNWETLCVTPCTIDLLPGHYQLQAAGDNVMPQDIFVQVSPGDNRSYNIEPGGFLQVYGGIMAVTLGGITTSLGTLYMLTMPDSEHRGAHVGMLLVGVPSFVLGRRAIRENRTVFEEL